MSQEEYQAFLKKNKKTKTPKYRNKKTTINGLEFDSAKEAKRYSDLCLWQHSGQIQKLEHQRSFEIVINGQLVCTYVSDFCYEKDGELIVEDVKSTVTKTPVYVLKKKLMKAVLNIDIQEY